MKEFFAQNYTWIIGILAVLIFGFQAYRALKKAKKIDAEGVETDAVVSRIEETWDEDSHSSSYSSYVKFRDPDGRERECPMTLTDDVRYSKGEPLRIRYLPGDYKMVRPVESGSLGEAAKRGRE